MTGLGFSFAAPYTLCTFSLAIVSHQSCLPLCSFQLVQVRSKMALLGVLA